MKKIAKGLLIRDDKVNEVEIVNIEMEGDSVGLANLVRLVDCDTIDAVYLKNNIDIFCDDEGLFKSGNLARRLIVEDEIYEIVGNLLFLSHDEDGNTVGLDDSQMDYLKEITVQVFGVVK